MKRCWQCDKELDLSQLKSDRQKKAAHVCADCVRKSVSKDELKILLNPHANT